MKSISSLQPENVWRNFYALTQIPRKSGHCEAVAEYVASFGKKLNLETVRDKIGNVLIRKPASKGLEDRPTIILQAHLDMVGQSNDTKFDFIKKPITTIIDGSWVKADGTTLGADNGIGVAAMLAILEDNTLKHSPIEALFTVDEETGMYGAYEITPDFIKGKIMLNLDSELDGDIYIGCAGGEDINARIIFDAEKYTPSSNDALVQITISGLRGGHSGVDIHLGRGNANKLMARLLLKLSDSVGIKLISFDGGDARNAIPRQATANVIVEKNNLKELTDIVADYDSIYIAEFEGIEIPGISFLTVNRQESQNKSFDILPLAVQYKFLNALNSCPNGVINRFAYIPDTVETSVNMSIVKTGKDVVEIQFLARSSSETRKKAICSSVVSAFVNAGGEAETANSYQGWAPDYASPILKKMSEVFERQRGHKPEIKVMHAGLECGIILANVPGLDTVSFGPTIVSPHSPDEKVEIESVASFWELLKASLA